MSSPSRPASQALISALTSLRLMSRSRTFSRFSFFSIGFSIESRRNRREVSERPLAALDLFVVRHAELEQVTDGGRTARSGRSRNDRRGAKTPERARDVGGDGRLFGDDQTL
jgi:hypothetical protein